MSTAIKRHSPLAPARQSGPVDTISDANGRSELAGLVSAAAEGDAESWDEITNRFTNLLWAVARSYRLSPDDAADVVQNTWLRLLENLRRIDHPEALPGWLATTARREALNLHRKRCREIPVDDQCFRTAEADTPDLDVGFLTEERDEHLLACFRRLPKRDQQLLQALMACERPSYAVVGSAFRMPVGSIGPTRMRALKRLHGLLNESAYAFGDVGT